MISDKGESDIGDSSTPNMKPRTHYRARLISAFHRDASGTMLIGCLAPASSNLAPLLAGGEKGR